MEDRPCEVWPLCLALPVITALRTPQTAPHITQAAIVALPLPPHHTGSCRCVTVASTSHRQPSLRYRCLHITQPAVVALPLPLHHTGSCHCFTSLRSNSQYCHWVVAPPILCRRQTCKCTYVSLSELMCDIQVAQMMYAQVRLILNLLILLVARRLSGVHPWPYTLTQRAEQ